MRDYPSLARPPRRSIAAETQPTEPVSFDDDQLVHESRILEAASISHSTLWRMTKAGRVPPPVMLSDRTKRYFFHKTMAAIRAIERSKGLRPGAKAPR
jgi:predicted DNA-binding transcriptional regulator AlpA